MGIGDFTSLEKIIRIASKYGCDSIGVNPLGAMYSKSKKDVSPYRVLSREYLNYIYLDLTTIEDFKKGGFAFEKSGFKVYGALSLRLFACACALRMQAR
jgi:4-alpha-glucanotransferase